MPAIASGESDAAVPRMSDDNGSTTFDTFDPAGKGIRVAGRSFQEDETR